MFAYEFEMAFTAATMAIIYNKTSGSIQTGQVKTDPMILIGWRQDSSEAYPGAPCLPGGFVDVPESTKATATRETEEETNIHIDEPRWQLFFIDDEPGMDPRYKQVVNVCYMARVTKDEFLQAKAGDDLKKVEWIPYSEVQAMELAFNHDRIIDELLIHLS